MSVLGGLRISKLLSKTYGPYCSMLLKIRIFHELGSCVTGNTCDTSCGHRTFTNDRNYESNMILYLQTEMGNKLLTYTVIDGSRCIALGMDKYQ